MGFVKKNYFSARKSIKSVEDVWETLPGWVERKGRRIHKATYCVPVEVFKEIEQKALRPLIPSVYENLPSSYVRVTVGSQPYIQYKACKYSVPRCYCFKTVCYKAAGEKLHIYDEKRKYICSHVLSDRKGSFNQLPEHKKEDTEDWKPVAERMRAKWGCSDFQHFINGFKKENPRNLYKQLTAVESFLDVEAPPKELVADVMCRCCAGFRYRFTQFQQVYFLAKGGYATTETVALAGVARQGMDAYRKAFDERCEQ